MSKAGKDRVAPSKNYVRNPKTIASNFLGCHFHRWPNNASGSATTAPTITYSAVRTVDGNNLKWSDLNTANGVYNWTTMDQVYAQHSGVKDIVYTVVCTPTWASARPSEARSPWGVLGGSAEPANMASLVTFIQAFAARYPNVKYYEVWNEPAFPVPGSGTVFYSGTPEKLAEMVRIVAQSVKAINPLAKILNPPPAYIHDNMHANWATTNSTNTWTKIFNASCQGYNMGSGDGAGTTAKDWIDIVGFHTYQGDFEFGFRLFDQISGMSEYLAAMGIGGLPKWSTEVGVLLDIYSNTNMLARKAARLVLSSAAAGCDRVFFYSWDHDTNGDGTPNSTDTFGMSTRPSAATSFESYINAARGKSVVRADLLFDGQIKYTFNDSSTLTI